MTVLESKAVTCYGKVTVAAQWNEFGQFRLIQVSAAKSLDHRIGTVYNPPAEGPQRAYFCNVFNLIAHHEAGAGPQQTLERVIK